MAGRIIVPQRDRATHGTSLRLWLINETDYQMKALEDTKTGSDGSTAKSIALDHLGDVAAKLRALNTKTSDKSIPTLDEIVASVDVDGLKTLKAAQRNIDNYLATSAESDDMFAVSALWRGMCWANDSLPGISIVLSTVRSYKQLRRSYNP